MGKLMPSAPISIGALASQDSLAAIRASGTHGVPDVAIIIAWADPRSIGPCSRWTMIQSSPDRAMICTVWMLGIVAIAPKVGRPCRHCSRSRLSGAGVARVKSLLLGRRRRAGEGYQWGPLAKSFNRGSRRNAATEKWRQRAAQLLAPARGKDHFCAGQIRLATRRSQQLRDASGTGGARINPIHRPGS